MAGLQVVPQLLHQFDAVLAGHHHVGDDNVGDKLQGFLQSVLSVGRFDHVEAFREDGAQEAAQLDVVLH